MRPGKTASDDEHPHLKPLWDSRPKPKRSGIRSDSTCPDQCHHPAGNTINKLWWHKNITTSAGVADAKSRKNVQRTAGRCLAFSASLSDWREAPPSRPLRTSPEVAGPETVEIFFAPLARCNDLWTPYPPAWAIKQQFKAFLLWQFVISCKCNSILQIWCRLISWDPVFES